MGDGFSIGLRRPMRSLQIAASGISAQRARLEAIASNIANAETTRGADGAPYRRKVVQLQESGFEPVLGARLFPALENGFDLGRQLGDEARFTIGGDSDPTENLGGVRVAGVGEDQSEGSLVYDPGHPDADENGYVRMPNVHITDEMVDMMDAQRLFEANASVFQAIKQVLHRASRL